MLLRIASALVLIPLTLGVALLAGPLLFLVALGGAGTLCLREFRDLSARCGLAGSAVFAYVGFWLLLLELHFQAVPLDLALAILVIGAFLSAMAHGPPSRERFGGMAADLFAVLYLALCLFPALRIRFDFGDAAGRGWLVVLFATIWAGDTAALLVGRKLGRTPFAPSLSPKKTNEGAIGGLLGGVAAAAAIGQLAFPQLPLRHVLGASVVAGVAGQLGDLAESMLKRAAGVKDSSQLIPGHGGVLDRVDSLLFGLPALYGYLVWVQGG
jgi:phosphatidate cytidylyltransferase